MVWNNIHLFIMYYYDIYVILLWVVLNKNKNNFMCDQSGLENTCVVFVWGYFPTQETYVFSPDRSKTHLFLL